MSLELVKGTLEGHKYINTPKVITKPWGKEIWLELNSKYCYKRIEIRAGFKTSFQVHNIKLETNYIIQGQAEVWLENDNNVVEQFFLKEGDFFTVLPTRKHRVIAITDVILQEVSTPEVDDVIRINDEFNRSNGKVEEEHCKKVVCILAAGTGSRMGDIGLTYHKSLLPLMNKAILSHIIEKFSMDTEIIIAVGYLKEQVQEYISFFHKDRQIRFINVDKYEGEGSGPAYSLECCRKELARPFYFCVCDFYTSTEFDDLQLSTENWIGVSKTDKSESYSTIEIIDMKPKQLINKTKNGYTNAFTGISYIYDYKLFWSELDKNVDSRKEIVDAFKNIELFNFKVKEIDWNDTGMLDLYKEAQNKYDGDKLYLHNTKNEYKYKKDNIFIKYIKDKVKINNIYKRGELLQEFIPRLLNRGDFFYSYEYFIGNTLYELNSKDVYIKFIDWFEENFCKVSYTLNDIANLRKNAEKFYKEKTIERIKLLKDTGRFAILDSITKINGIDVKPLDFYLEKIDWEHLLDTIPTKLFHGDLQFDNIVYNTPDFKLIDWREDFGGNLEYGDLYYDLAKLYGGMHFNYNTMKDQDCYKVEIVNTSADIVYTKDTILSRISEDEYISFLNRNNFDINKIKLLLAIIFINMSPLHTNNFDKLVFLKSKLILNEMFKDE
jgi:choline kinase/mannose-6-phosphate isomerase-like protein (cupin superfamily)